MNGSLAAVGGHYLGSAVLNRLQPVAVLWQGLGPERADRIPGILGNMLVPASEVAPTLAHVRRLLDVPFSEFFRRAEPLKEASYMLDESRAREILEALPAAFTAAREQGLGLVALSDWS